MKRYASNTSVSSDRSRQEIESTLAKYGATAFMYGNNQKQAVIVFEFSGKRMKFVLELPSSATTPKGRRPHNPTKYLDAEHRRRWRSLALSIKSKLVAVNDGISTIEYEFMANIMLPNGLTVGEWAGPQIESAYETGKMPPMLMLEAPRGND